MLLRKKINNKALSKRLVPQGQAERPPYFYLRNFPGQQPTKQAPRAGGLM
jgi:hypothetical protein